MQTTHQHPTIRCKMNKTHIYKENLDLDYTNTDNSQKIPYLIYKLVKKSKITIKMNEITILSSLNRLKTS